jgi:tetratricopeptide (TPR) repeat protein
MILLKGGVKEKPRRGNIYHEGVQRVHEEPDFSASFFFRAPWCYLLCLCVKFLKLSFGQIKLLGLESLRPNRRFAPVILFLLLVSLVQAQEGRPWWYILERGKLLFRQGDYGNALMAFEDARRQRYDLYVGMEKDLINFLSIPEVRRIGDSLGILEIYIKDRGQTAVAEILAELYYRLPQESYRDSALLALEELGKLKEYPEAEYWIGEVYRVEGEFGLALGQYNKALDHGALLEDTNLELELLYKIADLHRIRQEYKRMEEALLKIVNGNNARGQPWDPLWSGNAGSSGRFVRTSMARTLENSGPVRFLIMYRYDNGPVERAHRLLGFYYYASNRYNLAEEHLMFAFLIQNSIVIEELQRSRYDFVFESLESLMDAMDRREDLTDFMTQAEYYRCAYYLGSALYGIGKGNPARDLWTFLGGRERIGEWRGRALAQLQRPSLDAPMENPF